ncbi:imidazoleglycerol-phosphate dehydratase HisB [Clostridium sp.]|uniref:imidazoleglycerol-phosphate dehydratase HisB n=1 Tax=Clostridium sp. TaxID=1506 RepID=UPI003F6624A6
MRKANIKRKTKETDIFLELNLDGTGESDIDTGIEIFDHMLILFSFHSEIDLKVKCIGDIGVCDHHTVEDIGIALGNGIKEALGEKFGIERYGTMHMPMDESLALVSLDISGRPFLVFDCEFNREKVGEMSTEMVEEFFRAVAFNSGITLHINMMYGKNDHHKIEAIFKGFGRALKRAKEVTSERVQSTKGVI